jgi:hypothetical protein
LKSESKTTQTASNSPPRPVVSPVM